MKVGWEPGSTAGGREGPGTLETRVSAQTGTIYHPIKEAANSNNKPQIKFFFWWTVHLKGGASGKGLSIKNKRTFLFLFFFYFLAVLLTNKPRGAGGLGG